MQRSRDPSVLIRRSARRLYGRAASNWPEYDGWNDHKHRKTEQFILETGAEILRGSHQALDAGAGDSVYGWMPSACISLDRHGIQLIGKAKAVVADIERLPFSDGTFDLVICIGSVLNYVSAAEALNELARVTASTGYLYLHFETSTSFEQVLKPTWGATATLNRTVNAARTDFVWIYSPKYIMTLLKALEFKIVATTRFHILSALAYRIGLSQRYAYQIARLDRAASLLDHFADDMIILAQKD
jgi:SAM-dependent methyltransferase